MRNSVTWWGTFLAAATILCLCAIAEAQAGAKQAPKLSPAQQAAQLEAKCDLAAALTAYRKALKGPPPSNDPMVLIGIVRLSKDPADVKAVAKAVESQKGSASGGTVPTSLIAAAAYIKLGDEQKARAAMRTAAKEAQSSADGSAKPMAQVVTDVAALTPDVWSPLLEGILGAWSPCMRAKDASVKQLQEASKKDIKSGYVRWSIAVAFTMAGRMDLAKAEAKKAEPAARKDPQLAQLLQMFQTSPPPKGKP
jgi:tetratricopeptide (TPR) repeat protein